MKNIALMIILLALTALAAEPNFYPLTTIAEALVTVENTACDAALQDLDTLLGETHRGELVSARLYTNSGNLSNPSGEARFAHHSMALLPSLVFNGSVAFAGPAPLDSYRLWTNVQRYSPSPVKMELTGFNPATGAVSNSMMVVDPDIAPGNYKLVWFLLENNVGTASSVVREVLYHPITLLDAGVQTGFENFLTISPSYIQANLWAAVSLERDDSHIVQSASSLPLPSYSLRFASDWYVWGTTLDAGLPNTSYNSEPFWFFNTGAADNLQMLLVADNAPADWYLNYCDEEGNCYPGSMPLPLILGAGDKKTFHLNLWIGSTGVAEFHYEITSANLGTFTVPFRVRSSDYVSSDDLVQQPALRLEANRPNPFRGSTSFSVNAAKAGTTSIQVFNLRGQLVSETPLQNLTRGANSIAWQAPSGLAAGVYFYRLKGDPSSQRRMLLLK